MIYSKGYWDTRLEIGLRSEYIAISHGTQAMIENGECGAPRVRSCLPFEQRPVSMDSDALVSRISRWYEYQAFLRWERGIRFGEKDA